MSKRNAMAPIYIGDIGTITIPQRLKALPAGIDLEGLTGRELFSVALGVGIPLKDLIGIRNCYEHNGMIAIGDRALPAGYNYWEHVKYCGNCYLMFRVRSKK